MRNVTFSDFYVENTDYPIVIDQCYMTVRRSKHRSSPSRRL